MAKRKPHTRLGGWLGEEVDSVLLEEAEELACQREGTLLPGQAAIRKAVRDLLEARRRRTLSNEARAALGQSECWDGREDDEE